MDMDYNDILNINFDLDDYLNTDQLMSVPLDVPLTVGELPVVAVQVTPHQQEQDLFNTWGPTQTSENCGATSNSGTPEPEHRPAPKRGRPRSDNPKNPENTKRLREQRIKDKKKKQTFQQELEALRLEVAELERDEALMSELISETQETYLGMIRTGEL